MAFPPFFTSVFYDAKEAQVSPPCSLSALLQCRTVHCLDLVPTLTLCLTRTQATLDTITIAKQELSSVKGGKATTAAAARSRLRLTLCPRAPTCK